LLQLKKTSEARSFDPFKLMEKKPNLPRAVLIISLVSFFNDVASDMVIPLLPLLLAGSVGGGAIALGMVEGTADAVASAMRLWSGKRSDRSGAGRKPLALWGYILSNAVRPLLGLVSAWWGMLLLRAIDRVGKGVRSAPRDALLVDITPADQRGQAFGLHRAFDNAGAVLGALLAAWVLSQPGTDVRTVVMWSALPGLIAVLIFALGVKEPQRDQRSAELKTETKISSSIQSSLFQSHFLQQNLKLKRYLAALLLFTLSRSSETFIVLRGHELGISAGALLMLWAGLNAAKSLTAHLGGGWADQHGRLVVLRLSWVGSGMASIGLALAPSAEMLTLVALVGSLPLGLGEGAERAYIADLAPDDQRGTAYGWYNLTTGAAAIPAGLLFGGLWHYAGAPVAFGVAAVFGLSALLFLPTSSTEP